MPASAASPGGRIADLLDAGDTQGLETALSELRRTAAANRDAATLRDVYMRLFATTHPERRANAETWLETHPGSPYAQAAVAWGALTDVRLHSDTKVIGDARARALDLSAKAARSADFAPALEAWLFASRHGREVRTLGKTIADLLRASPTHATFLVALEALDGHVATTPDLMLELCLSLADGIPQYDADACIVDVAIRTRELWMYRDKAFEVLPHLDTPLLHGARALAALDGKHQMPAEEVAAWHLSGLVAGASTRDFLGRAYQIARRYDRPGFEAEARDALIAFIDARLPDDPLNPELIEARVVPVIVDPGANSQEIAEARALWRDAVPYGGQSPNLWELGALLEMAGRHVSDVMTALPYRENQAAVQSRNAYAALMLVDMLYRAYSDALDRLDTGQRFLSGAPDAQRVIDDVSCPMLRAARITDGICRGTPAGESMCDPARAPFSYVPLILAEGRDGLCDEVAEAPLRRLKYKLAPIGAQAWR